MSHVITTNSGLSFDFDNPTPDMISVDDVAVALGNCCRFAGHVRHYYSVAEHSCLVRQIVIERGGNAWDALAALWHDAHEAYLGDVPTPLKDKIKAEAPGVWEAMTGAIDRAIATKLGFDVGLFDEPRIWRADRAALGLEAAVLKPPGSPVFNLPECYEAAREAAAERILGYQPEDAALLFWRAHQEAMRELRFTEAT